MNKSIFICTAALCFLCGIFVFEGCKKNAVSGAAPTITSFSPLTDTLGVVVIIKGTNFSSTAANNIIKFNGTAADVFSATPTKLVTHVPVSATTGPISVTVNGQTVTSADPFTVLGPTITSFSPGLTGVGYPFVITGTNFSGDPGENLVSINGVMVTVTAASSMQMTAIVPQNASSGLIVVNVKGLTASSLKGLQIKKLIVSALAGTGGMGSTDGIGAVASFNGIWGIVSDGNGNYYTADMNNNKIRKITSDGIVTTFAGTGVAGNTDGGLNTATFNLPFGIAIDNAGNMYVSQIGTNNIREITAAGVVSTIAGDTSGTPGSTDGTGNAARFHNPLGLVTDANGNIFVVDQQNNEIRKINSSGVVTTLAGSGVAGATDANGSGASFNLPFGIAIDANSNLYISEFGNNKIRKVTQAGDVSTFAGTGSVGSTDGPVASATFNFPVGMAFDANGNMYVTDSQNGNIRVITPDGIVSTVAGEGISRSQEGIGITANFSLPTGIVMVSGGLMYVINYGSDQVIKVIVQ